jgi:recombination protein RecA
MKRTRVSLAQQVIDKNTRPPRPRPQVEFLSTGCNLFDLATGGGFPVGRMVNLVGDKSSGKSLLALEFIATALKKHSNKVNIVYDDTEKGVNFDTQTMFKFDLSKYRISSKSIEEFSCNIANSIKKTKKGEYLIYVVDSFDALTSEAEIDRMDDRVKKYTEGKKYDKGSYSMEKQKYSSEFFRSFIRQVEESNCILLIVSQVRGNLQPFGKKFIRVGGKALDFYASQIIWLYEIEKIFRSEVLKKDGFNSGIKILIEVTKNKVGKPFRKTRIFTINDYGVDNLSSNLHYLYPEETKTQKQMEDYIKKLLGNQDNIFDEIIDNIKTKVEDKWQDMEDKARIDRKEKF